MSSAKVSPALGAGIAILLGGLANIGLVGLFENHQMAAWIATLLATVALTACIGKAINGRWDGVIVSTRNTVSLSKLQMVAWTLLILSALVTAAAHNIHVGDATGALNINIDQHLLVVMGISTTSLVASPAVLSLKDSNSTTGATATTVVAKGQPDDASWLDIFRSDMADSADAPDLSKIQQFLVTLVVISAYAIMIGKKFAMLGVCTGGAPACRFSGFPPISEQLVWLIGISHAGYIAYKAAPKPAASGATTTTARPADNDDGAVG